MQVCMQIAFAIIFYLISVIFLFIFLITRKNEKSFADIPTTTGVIQSRKMVSDGPNDIYEIEIVCSNGEKKILDTQCCRNKNGDIPPDTVVNVKVKEKKILGINAYDIRIIDDRYVKPRFDKAYFVFAIITTILFIIGTCLLISAI